MLVEKQ
jgi:hypothetical protein